MKKTNQGEETQADEAGLGGMSHCPWNTAHPEASGHPMRCSPSSPCCWLGAWEQSLPPWWWYRKADGELMVSLSQAHRALHPPAYPTEDSQDVLGGWHEPGGWAVNAGGEQAPWGSGPERGYTGLESETRGVGSFLEADVLMVHVDPGRWEGQDSSPEATLVFTDGWSPVSHSQSWACATPPSPSFNFFFFNFWLGNNGTWLQ